VAMGATGLEPVTFRA